MNLSTQGRIRNCEKDHIGTFWGGRRESKGLGFELLWSSKYVEIGCWRLENVQKTVYTYIWGLQK